MTPNDENYSPIDWTPLVKPAASNMESILTRIGSSLLNPATGFRKCYACIADTVTHHRSRASQFIQHHLSIWSVVMTIDVDHVIVPTRDRSVAAKRLADLLGVPWAGAGPFSAVYVNNGLTLDFVETEGNFASHHYSFRVEEKQFNAILARLRKAGIDYRSTMPAFGEAQDSAQYCGSSVRWEESDGHQWEVLAVNRASQAAMNT